MIILPRTYATVPIGDSSYNSCCSFVRGGDCEAIEQYVLQTWHVAIIRCKDTQNTSIIANFCVT